MISSRPSRRFVLEVSFESYMWSVPLVTADMLLIPLSGGM